MRPEQTPISISIVTHETDPAILRGALDSIAHSNISVAVCIVDNSANDNLRSIAHEYGASYFYSTRNLGFGRAHNIAFNGIRKSKYHLVMNPDITFGSSALRELYEYMEINPEVGWLMPNVVFPDGSRQSLCKRLPTPWDLIVRRFLIHHGLALNSERQIRFECGDLDLSVPRTIPYLSGCFAFIRTEILTMVGGFDERFFLYLEDTDLVRRIGEIALTVFYPYVTVCHRYARGSYYDRRLFLHHVVSAIRYFSKWGWFFDTRRSLINESIAFDDRVHSTPQLAEALPSR